MDFFDDIGGIIKKKVSQCIKHKTQKDNGFKGQGQDRHGETR